MSEDTDIAPDIRAFLGKAFEGAEPPHRELADGSIRRGDAARRRNRVLGGAGGVTLGVAALVGTMSIVHGGAGGEGPAGGSQISVTVRDEANAHDKELDMALNLAPMLNPLLPPGMSIKYTVGSKLAGASFTNGGSFELTGKDGTDGAFFWADDVNRLVGWSCDAKTSATPPASANVPSLPPAVCQSLEVPDGVVKTYAEIGTASDGKSNACNAYYYFLPAGRPTGLALALNCGRTDHVQISPAQFAALVAHQHFLDVVDLADTAKPASAAAKKVRTDIDAAIARSVGTSTLPAGYSLRLSTTSLIGLMDLVSPTGEITGFDWYVDKPGMSAAESCRTAGSGNYGCSEKKVAGGRLFEGHIDDPVSGLRTSYAFVPDGGAQEIWAGFSSATSHHPMTPEQFLVMAKTPGLAQIIAATGAAIATK